MDTSKFDYKSLSLKKQYVWKLCKQILKDLKDGSCTDEQIDQLVATIDARQNGYINPEDYVSARQNGYINPEDYVSADKAMTILGVHRNQFFSLVKEHDIQCKKINGHSIGYYKGDINLLKNILKKK